MSQSRPLHWLWTCNLGCTKGKDDGWRVHNPALIHWSQLFPARFEQRQMISHSLRAFPKGTLEHLHQLVQGTFHYERVAYTATEEMKSQIFNKGDEVVDRKDRKKRARRASPVCFTYWIHGRQGQCRDSKVYCRTGLVVWIVGLFD